MSTAAAKDRPSLDLDNRSEQGFCAFFHDMPEKMANTVRLFERAGGEFYSVHGDDARFVARQIYKTNSVLKYLGGDQATGLPSCTMSRMVAETFLREALLVQQLRVEIWVSDAKRSQTSSLAGSAAWRLGPKASPGNLQELEDILFANSDMTVAPLVASIQLTVAGNQPMLGVAFADATQRYLGLTEFMDNDLYSNLESLLIQLGIRECLLPIAEASKNYDLQKVQAVLTRCNIVATECRRGDFQTKNVDQDFNRLLEDETPFTMRPEHDLKIALGAAACLLKYLALLTDETNFGRFRLFQHELSQYMRLDASALRALNLMPSQQLGAHKTMSLFGLLNHCKTSQGARLLNQWIKQPLLQLDPIRERQTLVQVFVDDPEMLRVLQEDHLRTMPDLNRLAKKFQSGRAQLQDVVRVYQCVVKLPGLSTVLGSMANEAELLGKWYLGPLEQNAEHLGKLQELVETMIDLSRVDQHEYHIKPDFDPTLADLQGQMQAAMDQIVAEQRRVSEQLHMEMDKKLKLEKSALFGYCLRLTRTEASCLRNKRSQYIELSVQKGGVLFTTAALKALNQDYRAASDEYQKVQSTLVKEVLGIVGTYCTVFETVNGTVAHLDVILSLAYAAIQAPIPYIRPTMTDSGVLRLVEARHPCLEVQDEVAFIPNDVAFARGQTEFQIITGPNMAGKSTFIRQTGVIVLMAQIGSFVPCSEAEVGLVDCILARVGAGDNQLKGISTFMAEMLETAAILKTATDRSLVIVDELGRGTSTHDGFGLAWAISEYILDQIQCLCLFATHFHELTALADQYPKVHNLHVMAHVNQGHGSGGDGKREITLLYKVKPGVCDQSFGIHVAELANFPPSVVSLARRKADELEDFASHAATESGHPHLPPEKSTLPYTSDDERQGRVVIEQFMQEFGAIPNIATMDAAQTQAAVQAHYQKYATDIQGNAYVRHVLQTFGPAN